MTKARLTESVLRQAASDWLGGKSWRALGPAYGCHPKYLMVQAKRMGFMDPVNIRKCPACYNLKALPEFTREGASGKISIMHECNACAATQRERQRPILPEEPLLDTELERLRQESIIHASAYLARVQARHAAMEITKARED